MSAESLQLTERVLANLSSLSLSGVSQFAFGPNTNGTSGASNIATFENCKTFPGDALWPNESTWQTLDLLTGGALIKTVPLASPCYDTWGNYDTATCAFLNDQWTNSSLQYMTHHASLIQMFLLTDGEQ